ncbi:MAG: hypothetical protein ACYCOU_12220 [Sulfobacillus sp.]
MGRNVGIYANAIGDGVEAVGSYSNDFEEAMPVLRTVLPSLVR